MTLSAVDPGLMPFALPDLSVIPVREAVTISLSVAIVIMAETLLAENSFAQKNGYRINDNQEIFAFAMGNLIAALTGCCPINGSVSRTAMGEQYQARTQLTGIVAGISMLVLLLGGTGFIVYLPVPILTAIVISALLGATEFDLAIRLWKISRTECMIFVGAFIGVLFLGTINGVLIGILLSFAEVIIRTAKPARCFLGIQPGHRHFRDLKESSQIHAVSGVLIYRFSSNLFLPIYRCSDRISRIMLHRRQKQSFWMQAGSEALISLLRMGWISSVSLCRSRISGFTSRNTLQD